MSPPPDPSALPARRQRVLGPDTPLFYKAPVHIVRGQGVWLWDAEGRRYLDCYNNVPHVGHANPAVAEAICRQSATLNVHSRYLHEGIVAYAERLTATLDAALSTVLFTCTGSEANDAALRMAARATGRRGIIVTDHTYHGNTAAVSALRTNRAGAAVPDHVRTVPAPDSLRPLGGEPGAAHARAFAAAVTEAAAELEAAGHGLAALLVCPIFLNEGFPDLPEGWLAPAARAARAAGGLVVADEVQSGFGRVGSHFWAHQRAGMVPDILTLGKPMGNGYPVAAAVTSRELMAGFRAESGYFNTFAASPVAAAAASAVLDELDAHKLEARAADVGAHARARLSELARRHPGIGNVRGTGLVFGAEFVSPEDGISPDGARCTAVVEALRHRGILLSSVGRGRNTLKIRPPMPFTRAHVDLLVDTLAAVLDEPAP